MNPWAPFDLELVSIDLIYNFKWPLLGHHSYSLFQQRNTMQSRQTTAHHGQSVTLSMEVSYPFHSHLIGRSGQNVNRLMEETGTRIHFPDRNRISGQSKSNNVVIRGQLADLENARQRIRSNVPIEFIIDCRCERVTSLGQSSLTEYLSSTFGVLLRFYPKIDGVNCQVNIRGQQDRIKLLKESVGYFGRVTQTLLDSVVMKMETSFDHVWLVRNHIEQIVARTGAGIRCPDLSCLKELPKKYSIWIRGSMDAVYKASTMLNGLLPMQLMIQIPSDRLNRIPTATAHEADILFHVERSVSDTLTIRLTSYEWNSGNLYELLSRCFDKTHRSRPIFPTLSPTWLELADFTRATFLLASKDLLSGMSSGREDNVPQMGGIFVNIPQSSPESSVTSFSSPRASIESSVPASLTASRFDPNSFRHLSHLLETVGLSRYSDLFLQNEIDMAMFTTLTDQDLQSVGVPSFGARKIMLNAIRELRR